MTDSTPGESVQSFQRFQNQGLGAQILPFPEPTARRVDTAARRAVRQLIYHNLITEREAVAALQDMGATESEVDLVRGLAAVNRGRL